MKEHVEQQALPQFQRQHARELLWRCACAMILVLLLLLLLQPTSVKCSIADRWWHVAHTLCNTECSVQFLHAAEQQLCTAAGLLAPCSCDMLTAAGSARTPLAITCFALRPNTNSMASITLDLPLPFGPTTEEKHCAARTAFVRHSKQVQAVLVLSDAGLLCADVEGMKLSSTVAVPTQDASSNATSSARTPYETAQHAGLQHKT